MSIAPLQQMCLRQIFTSGNEQKLLSRSKEEKSHIAYIALSLIPPFEHLMKYTTKKKLAQAEQEENALKILHIYKKTLQKFISLANEYQIPAAPFSSFEKTGLEIWFTQVASALFVYFQDPRNQYLSINKETLSLLYGKRLPTTDEEGLTLIDKLIQLPSITLDFLVQAGGKPPSVFAQHLINSHPDIKETLLLQNLLLLDMETMRNLLRQGANPNYIGEMGERRMPLLHIAVTMGSYGEINAKNRLEELLQCTELLLEQGADPNQNDDIGNTPLHRAIYGTRQKNFSMARLLLEKGANPNLLNHDRLTPLQLATHPDSLELLLQYGANPSSPPMQNA